MKVDFESTFDAATNTVICEKQSILFGIDFGTTYSGVAWACTHDVEQIQIIKSWDAELYANSENEKVLSAIHFGDGNGEDITWGYSIPTKIDPLKWFKLLLIDEDDLPQEVRNSKQLIEARNKLRQINKTAVEVIGIYLRQLWNHAIKIITNEVGASIVTYSKFHVVITLPAIWPEYARARMREAACIAGILERRDAGETVLTFISEPEAAAIATMSDLTAKNNAKVGDNFVVVDCGGGTVDLISYEVVGMSPMTVRESAPGKGALCGAIFVDNAFVNLFEEKVDVATFKRIPKPKFKKLVNDEWEHGIKIQFSGTLRNWEIDLPFECIDNASRRFSLTLPSISFTPDEIRSVFDPVINKIIDLVNEQVSFVTVKKGKLPEYIVLVGGFGKCKYLLESMKGRIGIEILQARSGTPWTAIARGALIHAMTRQNLRGERSVQVQSRIARANYGVICMDWWNPKKHQPKDRFFCKKYQRWMANNQVEWFVHVGDDMADKKPIRKSYTQLYETPPSSISETVRFSRSHPPPDRADVTVGTLCTVKWETSIDFTKVPTFTNSLGEIFYSLKFEVEMTCIGATLDVAVYYNGKRQGSKNVAVEFQDRFDSCSVD